MWSQAAFRVTLEDMPLVLPRNDVRQYEELAEEWWRPGGVFAMLHWIARARAALVPPATRDGAVLVDLGCGGGLLAPHVAGLGYRHVGVDLVRLVTGSGPDARCDTAAGRRECGATARTVARMSSVRARSLSTSRIRPLWSARPAVC